MRTTQTGIPVTECDTCGKTHPVTRRHCMVCGLASAFLDADGRCLGHSRRIGAGR